MGSMTGTYLPGTGALVEDLDKKLMVNLRDGRTLVGSYGRLGGQVVLYKCVWFEFAHSRGR